MSVIDTTRAPFGAITTFRLVTLFERVTDAFTAWRSARATAKVLANLSDKQLSDIGLHRADIVDVASALANR